MRKDSFERFYYEKVGLGEGCGCAEHVTRIRDLDALGQRLTSGRTAPAPLFIAIHWLLSSVRRVWKRSAHTQS